MKPNVFAALFITSAMISAPALANLELAKKSNCMSCHQMDKKMVGPAYQDVAKKYAGDPDAVKKLTEKVKKGGKGVWGQVPMPPNANVKDADIETLVKWILAGAK
ncbi:MAG: c-type cytochrome [Rhodocyclaceae bacterium]